MTKGSNPRCSRGHDPPRPFGHQIHNLTRLPISPQTPCVIGSERLELSRLSTLRPKRSVSAIPPRTHAKHSGLGLASEPSQAYPLVFPNDTPEKC